MKSVLHHIFSLPFRLKENWHKRLTGVYRKQYEELQRQAEHTEKRFRFKKDEVWLFKNDATVETRFDRHYVYHPAWAARIIAQTRPDKHVDISSSLHFCSMLSAFVPVSFYDYRPAELLLSDLESKAGDLMALPFEDASVPSLSCMHTVEHIGLGRYGDPIDYDGDLKAIKELTRVLAHGGNLLFVVPVGQHSILHFNGSRVYHPDDVKKIVEREGLVLKEFCMIPEDTKDGGLVKNPSDELLRKQWYACGCFWYYKPY